MGAAGLFTAPKGPFTERPRCARVPFCTLVLEARLESSTSRNTHLENPMNKVFIPAILAMTLSATVASADPYWGAFAPGESCLCDGFRNYSSQLYGIPSGQSPTQACYNTPAIITGHYFSGADICITIPFFGTAGSFTVGDASCSSTGTDPSYWTCSQDPASSDPACQICYRKLNCDTGQTKRTC
jgi:hypothetical protein